jgi:hypothetical protein
MGHHVLPVVKPGQTARRVSVVQINSVVLLGLSRVASCVAIQNTAKPLTANSFVVQEMIVSVRINVVPWGRPVLIKTKGYVRFSADLF